MEKILELSESVQGFMDANIINIALAVFIILATRLLNSFFAYIILKICNSKFTEKQIRNNAFYKPLKNFFKVIGLYMAMIILSIPGEIFIKINKLIKIYIIFLIANGFANIVTTRSIIFKKIQEKSNIRKGDVVAKFLVRAIKTVIYIIAGFMIIAEIGYDLSGLITGLGLRKCCDCTCCTRFS